jgi:hypothetical protein
VVDANEYGRRAAAFVEADADERVAAQVERPVGYIEQVAVSLSRTPPCGVHGGEIYRRVTADDLDGSAVTFTDPQVSTG